MPIAEREEQIIRIQSQSRYPQINQALEAAVRDEATRVTQTTVEAALVEELKAHLDQCSGDRPRRSGYYQRTLDTQYGRIETLSVPKLRHDNGEREWSILEESVRIQIPKFGLRMKPKFWRPEVLIFRSNVEVS